MTIEQKPTVDFDATYSYRPNGAGEDTNATIVLRAMDMLTQHCHAASYNRGWYHDPVTGKCLLPEGMLKVADALAGEAQEMFLIGIFPIVVGAKIALIHSETSEALEAFRVTKMDDKIPFPGITAEFGDTMIRIFDLLGMLKWAASVGIPGAIDGTNCDGVNYYDVGAAILAKIPFNGARPDHDLAKRAAYWGVGAKLL